MYSAALILISALTIGGIFISSTLALQQPQNTMQKELMISNDKNTTSLGTNNITDTNTTGTNSKNVSIVPNPAILEHKAYQPNPVQIKSGEIIIWTNNDLIMHTVTQVNAITTTTLPSDELDSGLLDPDQTYKHPFNKSGTIEYYCILHPTMSGKIIVS